MNLLKLKTMFKWPIPTMKKEVQAFLSFAKYYHWLIVNYSAKACPHINLTKDIHFTCRHIQQQAFNEPQARFCSTLILSQLDRTFQTIMETDASNQAIACILPQYYVINGCKQLHPIEYHAKTLSAI